MKKEEIFTVENAKVANVEYKIYNPLRDGYLKDAEGIVFVTVISVIIDLKNQTFVSTLQDAEGKEYIRKGDYDLYKNRECYEKGCCKSKDTASTISLIRRTNSKRLYDCSWVQTDGKTEDSPEYGYLQVWCFENGSPVATPLVVKSVICKSPSEVVLNDGSIPEWFWESKEDAFSFNEYKLIDQEGVEYTERGANLRVKPTEEQFEILNELKAVFKKAQESGLRFIWDRDGCSTVKAYNGAEVVEMECHSDAVSCQGGNVVNVNSLACADTGICFYDYYSCDDYCLVMQPTERQKKEWLKEHPENSEE